MKEFPDGATFYDEGLREGSLLRGEGTRSPEETPADTDPIRLPGSGHDITQDLDPLAPPGTSARIEKAIQEYRKKHPFNPEVERK